MHYPFQLTSFEAYQVAKEKSLKDPEGFWEAIAATFQWQQSWQQVVDWNFQEPNIKWFQGGKLNITENCLDRHLQAQGDRPAIIWEPNNSEEASRTLTYNDLYVQVNQFALVLKNQGVQKGDRVCIYMGMVPELAVAILACARIGAIHSVIFGGFSAQSIADRLQDAQAGYIITCNGAYRGIKEIALKGIIDDALMHPNEVKKVIVFNRTSTPVSMIKGRDVWWHEELQKVIATGIKDYRPEVMDAEDPLFILYTSGSTGKPKGVVHTVAGYMIYTTYTFVNVFQYQPGEVFFCTADIGWITGHSYVLYAPLCAGATTVMFEGIPTWPDAGRFWDIVDKHQVNILYTAPTAIRSLMSYGLAPIQQHDLSSLRVLGTVGEPINEEAWHWYHEHIGKGKCPIVDTWWQTETGGILISNLAGITPAIPSYATLPLPGVQPVLMDEQGNEILENNRSGNLCIKYPWPGMLRTTYGNHQRCFENYFSAYPNLYFTGDGCYKDEYGNFRITGRVDDVLNVSGHRLGTAEVENAINKHIGVIESAVVGFAHPIKGQGVYAFVVLEHTVLHEEQARKDITETVARLIGVIAKPDKIQFVSGLPKTRSGKIMRRILRKIAENETNNLGDTSTLLDPSIVDSILMNRL